MQYTFRNITSGYICFSNGSLRPNETIVVDGASLTPDLKAQWAAGNLLLVDPSDVGNIFAMYGQVLAYNLELALAFAKAIGSSPANAAGIDGLRDIYVILETLPANVRNKRDQWVVDTAEYESLEWLAALGEDFLQLLESMAYEYPLTYPVFYEQNEYVKQLEALRQQL